MRNIVLVLAVALLGAGSALASVKVTDMDFLRANRCKGLAASIAGVVDPTALDGLIKAERGSRAPFILDRAEDEFQRARKEARAEDRKTRLTAELAGPCQALLPAPAETMKR